MPFVIFCLLGVIYKNMISPFLFYHALRYMASGALKAVIANLSQPHSCFSELSWLNWCLTGSCIFSLLLLLFFRESYDRLYLDVFVSVWAHHMSFFSWRPKACLFMGTIFQQSAEKGHTACCSLLWICVFLKNVVIVKYMTSIGGSALCWHHN